MLRLASYCQNDCLLFYNFFISLFLSKKNAYIKMIKTLMKRKLPGGCFPGKHWMKLFLKNTKKLLFFSYFCRLIFFMLHPFLTFFVLPNYHGCRIGHVCLLCSVCKKKSWYGFLSLIVFVQKKPHHMKIRGGFNNSLQFAVNIWFGINHYCNSKASFTDFLSAVKSPCVGLIFWCTFL